MNLLTAVIFLPLVGALALVLVPRDEVGQHRVVALCVSLATFVLSIWLWLGFDAGASAAEFQFEHQATWLPTLGISYHVGVDGVALLLVLLTTVLTPVVILSAWKAVAERVKEFLIAILVLETAMIGTFAALDLVLFYVFWEAMLVPMYLLIGIWGSQNRLYATIKFFVYTFAASVLMLLAILYVYFHDGNSFDYLKARQALDVTPEAARWLFLAFAVAFAVKVPMFPLHTWLPDAHTEAPTAGSVILAGVLLKMGTFGFFRYALPLFPDAALSFRGVIAALAVVGVLYGAMMSFVQTDMKRLVAYSSVSHLGFVMLGMMALSAEALTGSVYQMLNHGISTGALFLLVGLLYERRHTRADRRLRRPGQEHARHRGRVRGGHAVVHRPPRHQRVRGRVPDPLRDLALPPPRPGPDGRAGVGGRDPGRGLHAAPGRSACFFGPIRKEENRTLSRSHRPRGVRAGPDGRPDRGDGALASALPRGR